MNCILDAVLDQIDDIVTESIPEKTLQASMQAVDIRVDGINLQSLRGSSSSFVSNRGVVSRAKVPSRPPPPPPVSQTHSHSYDDCRSPNQDLSRFELPSSHYSTSTVSSTSMLTPSVHSGMTSMTTPTAASTTSSVSSAVSPVHCGRTDLVKSTCSTPTSTCATAAATAGAAGAVVVGNHVNISNNHHHHRNHHQSIMNNINNTNNMINSMNNHSNNNNNSGFAMNASICNGGKFELKDYVFISKNATHQLSRFIAKEHWGKGCILLYKYLDYMFRSQLFGNQVVRVRDTQQATEDDHLIFHTGLRRRGDGQFLYGVLSPHLANEPRSPDQPKWRVQLGNIEESFMCKQQLMRRFNHCSALRLPHRTEFHDNFDENRFDKSCAIEVSWEERLLINQDRIYRVIGADIYFDPSRKHLKLTQLIDAFNNALEETKRMLQYRPSLACPQGFVNSKKRSYRMELLIPCMVQFPKDGGKTYTFALALRKSTEKASMYTVKSVLTLNMAYANARLVDRVDSTWLKYGSSR